MLSKMLRKTMRGRRERAGLTQAGLASRLGLNHMTVSRWERGVQAPTWAQLDAWYAATAEEQGRGE